MTSNANLDALLSRAVNAGELPNVVAIVGNRDGVVYAGAFGPRTLGEPAALTPQSVLWIASMSKAITCAAAMQFVEQGRLDLDAPAHTVLPALGQTQVLTGFDADGKPQLRAPRRAITLRHLLTHTVGFGYEFSSADIKRYIDVTGIPSILTCTNAALTTPLLFDPGERWEYGTGIDWAGKMVEQISGKPLGQTLQENLLGPLKMTSTSFKLNADQLGRLAGMHVRTSEGTLKPFPLVMPQAPEFELGGGGLYSTVHDYLRFMRMLMGEGSLDGVRVLRPETVAEMVRDQCGEMDCGHMPSIAPMTSHDVDLFPGERAGWGLSFAINQVAVPQGRSAGSLAWAGLSNCYYWIDLKRGISAMLATQLLPFFDPKTIAVLREFERVVYAGVSAG